MNDTKTYLRERREELAHRLAGRFLAFLFLFALSCAATFLWTTFADVGGVFLAVRPTGWLSCVRALGSSAVGLLAIYVSAHTVFSEMVSAAVILGRGLCLGCAGGLMRTGAVISIASTWVLALTLYFLASVGVILTAAYAHVYSFCLCRTHADGMVEMRRGIAGEFLRLFLILSGAVFLSGGAAVGLL